MAAESIFNLDIRVEDLKPSKRLDSLLRASKIVRVDSTFSCKKYCDISEGLLSTAKQFQQKGNHELALLHLLRYQELIKKLKTHDKYKKIPIGKRSAFQYKLKAIAADVKELKKILLNEYEKIYNKTSISLQIPHFDTSDDQRPTISTVRTYVSGQGSLIRDDESRKLSDRYISYSYSGVRDSHRASRDSFMNSVRNKADTIIRIGRSIFPTKQVRAFEKLYRQRRTVRSHRTLKIPSRLTTEFSHISFKNNQLNVETVGYLAGRELNEQELVVTHLLVPEQFGNADFFKVKDSYLLLRYMERNDLLILGWIHSHPSNSPYLSSSDMHYQSIFQSVLPEAVAVVYSPIEMKSTVFNLTPVNGLKLILSCRKKGFHVHPTNPPIVMVSQHAVIELCGDLVVKDFRNSEKGFECDLKDSCGDIFERNIRIKSAEMLKYRKSEVVFVHIS